MTIYIVSKMKGLPWFNFDALDAARDEIIRRGHTPISPADLDRAAGFDPHRDCSPEYDWRVIPPGFDFEACVTRDIEAVRRADAICMIGNWQDSSGALAEYFLARWLRKLEFNGVESVPDLAAEKNAEQPLTQNPRSDIV